MDGRRQTDRQTDRQVGKDRWTWTEEWMVGRMISTEVDEVNKQTDT